MDNFTFYAERPNDSYRRTDPFFIVSVLLLWGLGIFTSFFCTSAKSEALTGGKYYYLTKQLIWSAIGMGLMVFMTIFPMNKIRKYVPLVTLGTLFLCLLTFIPFISGTLNGSARWISIGSLTFQPSELAKFAMILFLANYFAKEEGEESGGRKNFIVPMTGLFVFVLIVLLQRDFSTAVLIFAVGLVIFFVAGAKLWWLFPFLGLALPAAFFLIFSENYRISRIAAYFNPENFSDGAGLQILRSQNAISEGGFWGAGLGAGLAPIYRIPELITDYIFAGWATALGFVGVVLYFIILVFFCIRAVRIAVTTPNYFASVGTFGCVFMIVVQSLVNCAVVCGVMPTTGIPLPFFSTGGSSLIVTFIMCGFILNASHCDAGTDFVRNYSNKNRDKESFNGVVVEYE